jgi:hypothetical protein
MSPMPSRPPTTVLTIPLRVIAIAVIVGAVAALVVWSGIRPKAVAPIGKSAAQPVDTTARPDTSLDIQWRSARMDGNDCIGTFHMTRGAATRAEFVAFVLDSTGKVVARDSTRVDAAAAGTSIEFRFRRVNCDRIADWQLEMRTPKAPSN